MPSRAKCCLGAAWQAMIPHSQNCATSQDFNAREVDLAALNAAVLRELVLAMNLLLEAGAGPNQTDFGRISPLQPAMIFDNTEVINLLLEFGASKDPVNGFGETLDEYESRWMTSPQSNGCSPQTNYHDLKKFAETPMDVLIYLQSRMEYTKSQSFEGSLLDFCSCRS
jgi:hypothetical protein